MYFKEKEKIRLNDITRTSFIVLKIAIYVTDKI